MSRRTVFPFLKVVLILAPVAILQASAAAPRAGTSFEISFPSNVSRAALDGRLLLLFSQRNDTEPRFHVVNRRSPQPFFGMNVEQFTAGQPIRFDESASGYPVESLAQLPAGDYIVQAVLHVYTTFHRSDGHVVKLPMDHWEGQNWNRSPGNLYSVPRTIRVGEESNVVSIELSQKIPPITPPEDTRFLRHVKIRSQLVSEFWGHDMDIGAVVLLPKGFDEHPEARYPVAYLQGHFAASFRQWREQPPDPEASGAELRSQQSAYQMFQTWTSDDFPRMLVVVPQDPNPFYDDAYAVNSANLGPYGDALVKELIPYVEKKFRALAEPWSRTLYGGSTGGWRALAAQIFYPDTFNGTWVFCPDPVDFRYFQLVNIYADTNAYYPGSGWKTEPIRPWMRSVDDQVLMTQRQASLLELALGTRGRSGDQMDIFQAVYGPVAEDGYPRLLYDKKTGEIDRGVIDYWRENYDLRHILERDWERLGPKLKGKLRIFMGDTDTYFLEEATRLLEQFLEATTDPYYDGRVVWGERAPHCFTGAPSGTGTTAHYLPEMAEHIRRTAPPGADLTSWRY